MPKKVALSFSGGKDSCFALHRLLQKNRDVVCLITTVWKGKDQTFAHDEKKEKLIAQGDSLGIPIYFVETDFEHYTTDFISGLKEIKKMYQVDAIAFGDIYLQGHRDWGEQISQVAGLEPLYPLWSEQRYSMKLLKEFVNLGFQAIVTKVDLEKLPLKWIDRSLDDDFIKDIAKEDVCPMGESGEYHTYVVDGPIFSYPLHVQIKGE